jgi:hypothetical protein
MGEQAFPQFFAGIIRQLGEILEHAILVFEIVVARKANAAFKT